MARLESFLRRWGAHLRLYDRRAVLARVATRYAVHGWDVVPGAFLSGERFDCGRQGCRTIGCHPAIDDWEAHASHDPGTVWDWWRNRPYAVLLATGYAFDVLDVPAHLGRPVVEVLPAAAIGGPVVTAPGDRWMFLVRPGFELIGELRGRADVVLHGRGSWIPAPPTRQPAGPVRWRLPPRAVGYRVADPFFVQSAMVAAMVQVRPPAAGSRFHSLAI